MEIWKRILTQIIAINANITKENSITCIFQNSSISQYTNILHLNMQRLRNIPNRNLHVLHRIICLVDNGTKIEKDRNNLWSQNHMIRNCWRHSYLFKSKPHKIYLSSHGFFTFIHAPNFSSSSNLHTYIYLDFSFDVSMQQNTRV